MAVKVRKRVRRAQAEFEAAKFYLDNLEGLNYVGNKGSVRILALESLDHAQWLMKKILEISADVAERYARRRYKRV